MRLLHFFEEGAGRFLAGRITQHTYARTHTHTLPQFQNELKGVCVYILLRRREEVRATEQPVNTAQETHLNVYYLFTAS